MNNLSAVQMEKGFRIVFLIYLFLLVLHLDTTAFSKIITNYLSDI